MDKRGGWYFDLYVYSLILFVCVDEDEVIPEGSSRLGQKKLINYKLRYISIC